MYLVSQGQCKLVIIRYPNLLLLQMISYVEFKSESNSNPFSTGNSNYFSCLGGAVVSAGTLLASLSTRRGTLYFLF